MMRSDKRHRSSAVGAFVLVSGAVLLAGPAAAAESGSAIDLSPHLPEWAGLKVFGVAVWQLAAAFLFILLGLVFKKVSDFMFKRKLVRLLERTSLNLDNLLATAASAPLGWAIFVVGLAGALAVLPLDDAPGASAAAFGAIKVLLAADFIWFLFRIVDVVVLYLAKLAEHTESKLDDQLVPLLRKALKVTLAIVISVWVVQLLGYSVSSLIAGLGIGGLAVALALQDTLGNFFGSIFIFLDRPFAPGDWIKVAGVEGIVEEIGFRSTKIRTWPESLVSVPNKTVANSTIDNWSKMPRRRVSQTIGVTYGTTPEQMEQAVAKLRDIVESDPDTDVDHYHLIRFTDFGESSLNIMVYYFTKPVGWDAHLAAKERVNLAIMRSLRDLGLEIAFPTRTVHIADGLPGGAARKRKKA